MNRFNSRGSTRRLVAPLLALCALCGCATITEKIGPKAAQAIMAYCLEPAETRSLVRSQVNALISPNEVKITCVGDAP